MQSIFPTLNKIKDLHFLKGEILYERNDFRNALKEFSFDTIESYTLARAATYIKLNQFDKALQNIKSQGNFENKWYLFYHDSSLSKGVTHLRSVKVTELIHDENGFIKTIKPYND